MANKKEKDWDNLRKYFYKCKKYYKSSQFYSDVDGYILISSFVLALPLYSAFFYERLGLYKDYFGVIEKYLLIPWYFKILPTVFLSYVFLRVVIGFFRRQKFNKVEHNLALSGLKNHLDEPPIVIKEETIYEGVVKYHLNTNFINFEKIFQAKKEIESKFKLSVIEITERKGPGFAEILLSKHQIPEKLYTYDSVKKLIKEPGDFIIGHSQLGLKKINILKLPHLMISGTTNSGKSSFLKQTIWGITQSHPEVQLKLMDLKEGLELVCFKDYPNSQFTDSISGAAVLLKSLEDEMKNRFKMLRTMKLQKFKFGIKDMPFTLICIDEASVIFGDRPKEDPEYKNIQAARSSFDNLAKLCRVVGMHLIVSTQKINKDAIPVHAQEMFSGRVSFFTNTLEASTRSVGGSQAKKMKKASGRGIWNFGLDNFQFLSPYIDNQYIENQISLVSRTKSGKVLIHKVNSNFSKLERLNPKGEE